MANTKNLEDFARIAGNPGLLSPSLVDKAALALAQQRSMIAQQMGVPGLSAGLNSSLGQNLNIGPAHSYSAETFAEHERNIRIKRLEDQLRNVKEDVTLVLARHTALWAAVAIATIILGVAVYYGFRFAPVTTTAALVVLSGLGGLWLWLWLWLYRREKTRIEAEIAVELMKS